MAKDKPFLFMCIVKMKYYLHTAVIRSLRSHIQLVLTPNGQISEMLHYTKNIFNTYYCEIRFIVFHFNAGRYHVKFCFSSKTRVSHFRKSLETA